MGNEGEGTDPQSGKARQNEERKPRQQLAGEVGGWGSGPSGSPRSMVGCRIHAVLGQSTSKPLDIHIGLPDEIQDAQVNLNFR